MSTDRFMFLVARAKSLEKELAAVTRELLDELGELSEKKPADAPQEQVEPLESQADPIAKLAELVLKQA